MRVRNKYRIAEYHFRVADFERARLLLGTQVRADGIPPLQGRHMIVCLGGYNDSNF